MRNQLILLLGIAALGVGGDHSIECVPARQPLQKILVATVNAPAWTKLHVHKYFEWRDYKADEVPPDTVRPSDIGPWPFRLRIPIRAGELVRRSHLKFDLNQRYILGYPKYCRCVCDVPVDHRDAFVESLDDEMLVDVDVLISSDGNFDFTQSTDWRTVLSAVPIYEVNKKRDGTVVQLLLLDVEREKLRLAKEIGEISIRSPLRPTRTQPVNKALTQHSMTEQNAFTRRTAAHGHDEEACHKLVQNATAGTSSPNH